VKEEKASEIRQEVASNPKATGKRRQNVHDNPGRKRGKAKRETTAGKNLVPKPGKIHTGWLALGLPELQMEGGD